MQPFVPKVSTETAKYQAVEILQTMDEHVVIGLMERIKNGKFDGSRPEFDFFATKTPLGEIKPELRRFLDFKKTNDSLEPIESYTFNIKLGDTPKTNERLSELYAWCEMVLEKKALARRPTLWSGSICGMDGYSEFNQLQPNN